MTEDIVDVECEDVPSQAGTEVALYDAPGSEVTARGRELETAEPVVTATVRDLDAEDVEAEVVSEVRYDAAAAADGGPTYRDTRGGGGIGGGSARRRRRDREGRSGRGGGGFTLFGFTLNIPVSFLNNLGAGNRASLLGIGDRHERKAKAARLTRGGRSGSQRAMRRKILRSRWLDQALGGGKR